MKYFYSIRNDEATIEDGVVEITLDGSLSVSEQAATEAIANKLSGDIDEAAKEFVIGRAQLYVDDCFYDTEGPIKYTMNVLRLVPVEPIELRACRCTPYGYEEVLYDWEFSVTSTQEDPEQFENETPLA
jgi:hypothetical protein